MAEADSSMPGVQEMLFFISNILYHDSVKIFFLKCFYIQFTYLDQTVIISMAGISKVCCHKIINGNEFT